MSISRWTDKEKAVYVYCIVVLSSLSCVWLFATPRTVACETPLSVGVSMQELLEWVAISFSRGNSWPKDWAQVSCLAGRLFIAEPPGKSPYNANKNINTICSNIKTWGFQNLKILDFHPVHIYSGILFSYKKRKYCHLQRHNTLGIMPSNISQTEKIKLPHDLT